MKKIWISIKKFFGWKPKVTPTPRNNFMEWGLEEQEIGALISIARDENRRNSMVGMKQIIANQLLWYEARKRCSIQTGRSSISHDGVGEAFTRLTEEGYKDPAEILGYGYTSAEAVVDAWLKSSSHKRIILNPLHTHFGVGRLVKEGKYYYCVLFAK